MLAEFRVLCENRSYTDDSRWTRRTLRGRSHTRQICTPLTNSQIKSVVTVVQKFSYCAAETGMTGCRLPTSSKPMRSWRCGGLAICAALTPSLKAGRVLISDVKARLMVRHHRDDAGSWQHRSRMLVEQVGGGDLVKGPRIIFGWGKARMLPTNYRRSRSRFCVKAVRKRKPEIRADTGKKSRAKQSASIFVTDDHQTPEKLRERAGA